MDDEGCPNDTRAGTMPLPIRERKTTDEGTGSMKPGNATWRLWLGFGLGGLAILSAALSTVNTVILIFLALSALIALVGLVQLSLWSRLRQS